MSQLRLISRVTTINTELNPYNTFFLRIEPLRSLLFALYVHNRVQSSCNVWTLLLVRRIWISQTQSLFRQELKISRPFTRLIPEASRTDSYIALRKYSWEPCGGVYMRKCRLGESFQEHLPVLECSRDINEGIFPARSRLCNTDALTYTHSTHRREYRGNGEYYLQILYVLWRTGWNMREILAKAFRCA